MSPAMQSQHSTQHTARILPRLFSRPQTKHEALSTKPKALHAVECCR